MTPEDKRTQIMSNILAQLHNSTSRGDKLRDAFTNHMKMFSAKIDMAMVACNMKDEEQLERLRLECESHMNTVFDGFREAIRMRLDGEKFVADLEKQLKDM